MRGIAFVRMVAGYDTRSLVAMIMLLQMLKVARVVWTPAVRCDDALNTTPVPAKIQSVEEVGAKKCVQAWIFELATAARPVTATLESSAIGILDNHVVGGHLHRTKARTQARQESSCKCLRTPQWVSFADSSFGDLLVD